MCPPPFVHGGNYGFREEPEMVEAFMTALGHTVVAAVQVQKHQHVLVAAQLTERGLEFSGRQCMEAEVLALAVMPGGTAGQIAVLTPHGLLICPQQQSDIAIEEKDAILSFTDPVEDLQLAYSLYSTGQEG